MPVARCAHIGQLVHVPAHPRRQRRGLVVRRHRGQVAPRRIAEQQLREPRLDVADGRAATASGTRRSDAAAARHAAATRRASRRARRRPTRGAGCPTGTTGSPARCGRTTGRAPSTRSASSAACNPSASTTPSAPPATVPHHSHASEQCSRNTVSSACAATGHAGCSPRSPYNNTTCRPNDQKATTKIAPSTRRKMSRTRDRV